MKKLVKIDKDERCFFTGTFENSITRYDYRERRSFSYVRIRDVVDEYSNYICNNVEFNMIKGFSDALLQPGDRVLFRARPVICKTVEDTYFGYFDRESNVYRRLMNPTKITKLISPVSHIGNENTCKIKIIPTKNTI